MDQLTLLQSCSIAQYSTDAETLAQAIAHRPAWMQPLATSSHLWILRGDAQRAARSMRHLRPPLCRTQAPPEPGGTLARRTRAKSGGLTLLESSRFAKDLSESESTVTDRLRNLPAEIAEKWLSHKYLQMRQMSWVGRDTPR